jgi:hypothetical protein
MTPPFDIRSEDEAFLNRLFHQELHLVELSGPFYDMFAVRLQTEPTFSEVKHMTTTLIHMATAKGCRGALGWRRGHSDAGYDLAVVGIKA